MTRYFTSQTFERSAAVAATTVALHAKRGQRLPVMLVAALLLALVFGRMLDLGFSILVVDGTLDHARVAPAPTEGSDSAPELPTGAAVPVDAIARGMIEGMRVMETAFVSEPPRQLPPPVRFLSADAIPCDLRTADFTSDLAILSGTPGIAPSGAYAFDFHDGGLRSGEVYNFLTFVTQSYRPASLRDQRLLLPLPARSPAPDVRYVAR
jgi:hypothetical protein